MSATVFKLLNDKLVEEFYTDNIIETFKGYRILAVDGTNLRLPRSSQLYAAYGTNSRESMPLARASTMYDVLNNITLFSAIGPYIASERDLLMEYIEELSKLKSYHPKVKNILTFDRGYPSRALIYKLHDMNEKFLMRVTHSFLNETNDVIKSGETDSIVTISTAATTTATRRTFAHFLPFLNLNTQVKIRVLTYTLKSGEKEFLVTSLTDKNLFSYEDIFTLHSLRWNIEENYKYYKSIAEIENFSGMSKQAIEQEFFATIFSCNVTAILVLEAQEEIYEEHAHKNLIRTYKVNRNIALGLIKNEIMEVLLGGKDLNKYCENLKVRIKRNLVSIRPGRMHPRQIKVGKKSYNKRSL